MNISESAAACFDIYEFEVRLKVVVRERLAEEVPPGVHPAPQGSARPGVSRRSVTLATDTPRM